MLNQVLAVIAILLLMAAGMRASNWLHDRGVARHLPRRLAHVNGGMALLLAVLWLDAWTAVALAGGLTLSLLILRLGYRRGLRGISRTTSDSDWAEMAYPMAATFSIVVGWALLGDRWLGFLPIAFMAWGDSVAGLTRATIWKHSSEKFWPSIAMLGICLAAAALFHPYWIGAVGALVAAPAERFRLLAHSGWEDNWIPDDPIIVVTSLTAMAVLLTVTGL